LTAEKRTLVEHIPPPIKANLVRSPEQDSRSAWLPNFNGVLFVQGYVCDNFNFHEDLLSFSRDDPNCGKCPVSLCWKIFKKCLDPDADGVQHLISFCSSTDTSVLKFSRRSVQ